MNKSFVLLAFFPFISMASSVPEGFEDLFQLDKQVVQFKMSDGFSYPVKAMASYDLVRVTEQSELDKIRLALESNNIDKNIIENVLVTLQQGTVNTEQCNGRADECIVFPTEFEFYYDYYTNTLYFWVNEEFIEKEYAADDVRYAPVSNEHGGIINHTTAYLGGSDTNNPDLSFYDDTTIGFKYGYFESELLYQSNDDDFDVDKAKYSIDVDEKKFRLGYESQNQTFNTTDYLLGSANNNELSLEYGTSTDAIIGGAKTLQKIFFFAPRDAILTVYRDEKILFQRQVKEGQGFITQDDLPRGRYNIELEIKVAGEVVSKETRSVFNSNDDTLRVKGVDYHLTAGTLVQDSDVEYSNPIQESIMEDVDGSGFGRALFNYRVNSNWSLGAGLTGSAEGHSYSIGSKFFYDDFNFQGLIQKFDGDAKKYELFAGYGNISFDMEVFRADLDSHLATFLYDIDDYERYNLTYSTVIDNVGYAYASLNKNASESVNDLVYSGYDSTYLTMGLSFPGKFSSNFDLSVDYNFDDGEEVSVNLVWRVPLSELLNSRTSIGMSQQGVSQFSNYLESNDLLTKQRNKSLYATVGNTYQDSDANPNYSSASLSAQANEDAYSTSGYLYADTSGKRNYNLTFDSTQVVSQGEVYGTRYNQKSYAVIDSDNNIKFERENSSRGLAVVKANGSVGSKKIIYKDTELLALKKYQNYEVMLDTDSVDIANSGSSSVGGYSYPGTVMKLNTNLTKVVTFISGFKNFDDKRIEELECNGDACVDVSEIQKGIYKISVEEGKSFDLSAAGQRCFVPSIIDASAFNLGMNYCLPNLEPGTQLADTEVSKDGKKIIIVGLFNEPLVMDNIKNNMLIALNGKAQLNEKQLGRNTLLYLELDSEINISEAVFEQIEDASKFAIDLRQKDESFAVNE
ncbi:TcfC E-set like domain-containing protein [Vibrio alginolyticus]|uniref:CS1-pili formation C-terminal domain-containing protein n=1 Tax=Vibrio TaxID=662 RepID=UPI00102D6E17|nr:MULTISPECIES: CS1-pili formation C-terminal domain-containing protein [Vibrio]EMB9236012.1 TcfC E-set like domain-containing protein [Vibrio alginolyticus]MCF7509476.1 TcfC E-set like domain-containing protein [Vibrio sp. D54]RZV16127.1 hypothetical protein EOJ41_18930 [Vibrio alginolyticus]